jgi:hypothetical protein
MSSVTAAIVWLCGSASAEQHEHHDQQAAPEARAMPTHQEAEHTAGMDMEGPLGISHSRWGSGTAWQPDTTPLAAVHATAGEWNLMLHWNVHAGYDGQGSDRGAGMFMSTNWVMGMATHALWGGQLGARAMLSLEPVTATPRGYPLLLQSGESYLGEPLHDRQHPHDLFMEVAVRYLHAVSDDVAVLLYLAPSGEPALGPPGFPHRWSAMPNPFAPIGHHWQDSTHISFGVVTAGIYTRRLKIDGSWFNGREPDEHRYDFDLRRPDSVSGRLTFDPAPGWSLQASYGYLASPEAMEPEQSVHRLTASAAWDRLVGDDGNLAVLAAWGRNVLPGHGASDSGLVEGTLGLRRRHTIFGRGEYVRKSAHELAVPLMDHDTLFDAWSLAFGYMIELPPIVYVVAGLGIVGTAGLVAADLEPAYGTRTPLGGMVFLSLRPPRLMSRHDM